MLSCTAVQTLLLCSCTLAGRSPATRPLVNICGGQSRCQLIVCALQVDMAKEAEVEALIRHTISAHGRLDVFVNNAARYVFADALDVTEEGEAVRLLTSA